MNKTTHGFLSMRKLLAFFLVMIMALPSFQDLVFGFYEGAVLENILACSKATN